MPYINDLNENLGGLIRKFADVTKINKVVDSEEGCHRPAEYRSFNNMGKEMAQGIQPSEMCSNSRGKFAGEPHVRRGGQGCILK